MRRWHCKAFKPLLYLWINEWMNEWISLLRNSNQKKKGPTKLCMHSRNSIWRMLLKGKVKENHKIPFSSAFRCFVEGHAKVKVPFIFAKLIRKTWKYSRDSSKKGKCCWWVLNIFKILTNLIDLLTFWLNKNAIKVLFVFSFLI